MNNQQRETDDQILRNQQVTLLELLDRLLDKGVMAKGEILLSVADIDLVYLNLGLLLSSVKTVKHAVRRGGNHNEPARETLPSDSNHEFPGNLPLVTPEHGTDAMLFSDKTALPTEDEKPAARVLQPEKESDARRTHTGDSRANIDPKNVEKGLAKLVLTLVDLIRKLMEKQAIRRIEDGQLSPQEIERVGNAFFILDEKMEELKEIFGFKGEDLNLDLGPLGDLL